MARRSCARSGSLAGVDEEVIDSVRLKVVDLDAVLLRPSGAGVGVIAP